VCEKKKNLVLRLSWDSSHPKKPKTRFLDGALVGARSFKPRKKNGNFRKHKFFFMCNQAMNNLGR
jgi:hypothetical protein